MVSNPAEAAFRRPNPPKLLNFLTKKKKSKNVCKNHSFFEKLWIICVFHRLNVRTERIESKQKPIHHIQDLIVSVFFILFCFVNNLFASILVFATNSQDFCRFFVLLYFVLLCARDSINVLWVYTSTVCSRHTTHVCA